MSDFEPNDIQIIENAISAARDATSRQDWSAASILWAALQTKYPDVAVAYVLGGYVALQQNEIEKAENLLEYATRNYPNDAYAHLFYAEIAQAIDQPLLFVDRLVKIGSVTDPHPYHVAFEFLVKQLDANRLDDQTHLRLVTFLCKEDGQDSYDFIPVALKHLNVIQETNDRVYHKIYRLITENSAIIRSGLARTETFDLIAAAANIESPSLDLKSFAARQMLHGSVERCYEIFHRHAFGLLDASKSVFVDLVTKGHIPELEPRRKLLLAQIASAVDENIYSAVRAEASAAVGTAKNETNEILVQGFRRRSARLSVAINRGIPDRPLNIALCISGQLRGYELAYQTWDRLGLSEHRTKIFVDVWKKVGRKFPVPQHAMRTMSGHLLDAYRSAFTQLGHAAIVDRYPTMFRLFELSGEVTANQLSTFYKTPFVNVEDDTFPTFSHMNNFQKMYHKIKYCHNQAETSGDIFDLIIRIRPDKSVVSAASDYHRILYESRFNGRLYTDVSPYIHCKLGYVIGDQFAIGEDSAMRSYASAYDQTIASALSPGGDFPSTFYPHVNLAAAVLSGGLDVRSDHGIHFGELMDASPVSALSVLEALKEDIDPSRQNDTDRLLIEAARIESANEDKSIG
jgi:tetratricopeptide (TPR) repeat protein